MKKILILFFILCFFGSSISCQKKPIYSATGGNTTPSANWTVMFYMGGTNNLQEVLESEINLLEKRGITGTGAGCEAPIAGRARAACVAAAPASSVGPVWRKRRRFMTALPA